MIEDLAEGWLAFCDLDTGTGTVALFDVTAIEKAHAYMMPSLNTLEWYYRAREIAAGDAWETEYTLVPLADSAPVIAANAQYVITADPLRPVAGKPLTLTLSPSAGPLSATVTATGADGSRKEFEAEVMLLTPKEVEYFRHGGLLHYVLRELAGKATA
mgnify:CR=1 FL=1